MILASIQPTQDYSRPPCFSVRHIVSLHQSLIQSQPLWSSCPHPPGSNSSPSLLHLPLGSPDWLKISELPQGPQRPGENADGRMSTSPCLTEKLFPSLLSLRPPFIPIPPRKNWPAARHTFPYTQIPSPHPATTTNTDSPSSVSMIPNKPAKVPKQDAQFSGSTFLPPSF